MPLIDFRALEKAYDSTVDPHADFVVIRLDMRAGTTWTKRFDMEKPYDIRFANAMLAATVAVSNEIPRALFAYEASDEITIIVPPYTEDGLPCDYYSGRIQKMVSIAASTASTAFYRQLAYDLILRNRPITDVSSNGVEKFFNTTPPTFDGRVFTCTREEAYAAIRSRQKSVIRNSIRTYGHYKVGDKAMRGLSNKDLLASGLIPEYDDMPGDYRIGTMVIHERDFCKLDGNGGLAAFENMAPVAPDELSRAAVTNLYIGSVDVDDADVIRDIEFLINDRFAFEQNGQSPSQTKFTRI